MKGKMLWDKFAENGKVSDYLEYRRHINGAEAEITGHKECMELTDIGQNQCFGISDKRTERR